jgi:hypothetical protein
MNRPMLPWLGAACGIVFPIAMFLAVGNGSHFTPWRAVAATWALVLALPFLAYLYSLRARAAGSRPQHWLPAPPASCSSWQATHPNWPSTMTGSPRAPSSTRPSTTPPAQPP